MNRNLHNGISELAEASRQRLADAKVLLDASRWRGAMYMAGYAVECLLKTKLMHIYNCKNLRELEDLLRQRSILPADRTVFTHQLEDLLRLTPGYNRLRQDRDVWHMFHEVKLMDSTVAIHLQTLNTSRSNEIPYFYRKCYALDRS